MNTLYINFFKKKLFLDINISSQTKQFILLVTLKLYLTYIYANKFD